MAACDRRTSSRATLDTSGVALRQGRCLSFRTLDLSLGGGCIEVRSDDAPDIGTLLRILLLTPGFGAKGVVRWLQPGCGSTTLVGLQFLNLDFLNTPPPVALRPTYYV